MFLNILGTFFLSFGLGAKTKVPKYEANVQTNSLHSTYVLNDDTSAIRTYVSEHLDDPVDFDFNTTKIYVYAMGLDGAYYYLPVTQLNLKLNTNGNFGFSIVYKDFEGYVHGGELSVNYQNLLNTEFTNIATNVFQYDGDSDFPILPRFQLFFYDFYYINTPTFAFFNKLFTTGSNSYFTRYNGYYNFVDWQQVSAVYGEVVGSFSVNNSLFNCFRLFVGHSDFVTAYPEMTGFDYFLTYGDTIVQLGNDVDYSTGLHNNNIYINAHLPTFAVIDLNASGTFGYVPMEVHQYSFKDFFFSIMDSPLYAVYSLLNFEVFGTNLYIGLTGLLTIVVILLVIRKFL